MRIWKVIGTAIHGMTAQLEKNRRKADEIRTWLERGSAMVLIGALFCIAMVFFTLALSQSVAWERKGVLTQAAVDAVADGTAIRARQDRLDVDGAWDAAEELTEYIAENARIDFSNIEMDRDGYSDGVVRITGTSELPYFVQQTDGSVAYGVRRTAATSFRRSFAGAYGGVDSYGTMDVPWIRQDSGLVDPLHRDAPLNPACVEAAGAATSVTETSQHAIYRGGRASRTVASTGCGICAAAMALSYCIGDIVWPGDVIRSSGFLANEIGEYQSVCSHALCADFGLPETDTTNRETVNEALLSGCPVLVLIGGQDPSGRPTRGHYLLLVGYDPVTDKYVINDPGGWGGADHELTYVSGGERLPGRDYLPTDMDGLWRPLWSWESFDSHRRAPYAIFGMGSDFM